MRGFNKFEYNFGSLANADSTTEEENIDSIELNKFISTDWTKLITVAHSDNLIHDVLTGKSSRSYGKLVHSILSNIETVDDVDRVIEQLHDSGVMDENELVIVESIIKDIVTDKKLEHYFSRNLIVKNETEVMLQNGEIVRPDRVVLDGEQITIIDYKTGEEKDKDHQQVKNYRNAFIELGYSNISMKLVYLSDVVRVVDVL